MSLLHTSPNERTNAENKPPLVAAITSYAALANPSAPASGTPRGAAVYFQAAQLSAQTRPAETPNIRDYHIRTERLAAQLHEDWRATQRQPGGTYNSHFQTTTDPAWITTHRTNQIDIANTLYQNLPEDLQQENRTVAEGAIRTLYAMEFRGPSLDTISANLDENFVNRLACFIHRQGSPNLFVPFYPGDQLLPEAEKQKYRVIALHAIEICFGGIGFDLEVSLQIIRGEIRDRPWLDYSERIAEAHETDRLYTQVRETVSELRTHFAEVTRRATQQTTSTSATVALPDARTSTSNNPGGRRGNRRTCREEIHPEHSVLDALHRGAVSGGVIAGEVVRHGR